MLKHIRSSQSSCALALALALAFASTGAYAQDGLIPTAPDDVMRMQDWPDPAPDILLGRIECLEWARAQIKAEFMTLEGGGQWTPHHQMLWNIQEASAVFEQANIRPWVDAETQGVILAQYWPDGVLGEGVDARARTCAIYRGSEFLRTAILGPEVASVSLEPAEPDSFGLPVDTDLDPNALPSED